MTVYYAKCFTQDMPWAVELLSDILKNSKFESSQIERERGVILREMEEIESNYQEVIFDYLHATAYQGTPLGRTILGPVENVKSLKATDLKEFIKCNYKAPRMVLCAAGGIDHTQLAQLAEKHFGDFPASYGEVGIPSIESCRFTGSEIRDRDDAMPLAHAAIAFEGPGWTSPDTLALMVASSIHGAWDRSYGGGTNVASKLAAQFFSEDSVHSFQHFFTCYHDTSLCCLALLPAVELLSDILKNSKFESSQIERERGVILREMEEIESNYQEVIFDYLHATAYQGTPLGRTILGPVENVKSLKATDLKEFIKCNYKAPRMVLCAAGGIDHTQLAQLAEKHFGDFPASYGEVGIPSIESCRFTGSEIRDRDDAMPLAHAAIAFEGPGWTSPDTLALMVASSIHGAWDRSYGGGTNVASKLAAQFFSEDSVHSFQHFFTCYHDTSLWGVYLTAEKLGLADGVNAFMKEFVRMCTQITPHEVERAKNQLKTHLLLQLDGTTPVCEEIGRHMLVYGRRIPLTEMLERIDLLNTEHIRDTCMKYFYDHCPAVTSLGPIETMPDYNRIRDQTWWLRL
ncbi:hypothetical protein AHF37_04932 [Paragonimus kellicotti]|nr:hypothetical protein AHF37_04932 [Paragonimus kellicotti]